MLKVSQTLQITALEATATAIVITDQAGSIVWANSAFERLTGFTQRRSRWPDHARPQIRPLHPRDYKEMWQTILAGKIWRGEIINRRKDGTLYDEEMTITPVHDPGDATTHFIAVKLDISARKLAERRISLLSQAIENSSEFIAMGDTNGNISFANDAWLRALGYTEQEVIGQNFQFILSPNNSAEILEGIDAKTLAGGWTGECLQRCKDGSDLPVLLSTGALKDRDGNFTGVFGIARDISDRKKMEDKLRRLAAIVESSDDAIISKTLDGVIQSWNRGAERMYGYSAAEAIGKPIAMLCPPGQRDEIPTLLEKVKRGEGVEHYESVRVKKDGKQIRIALTISPVRDSAGTIIGASAIGRNITDTKQMEEMFRQSQKMEAVGRLAGGVAHDFNNMLSVIIGYSEILLERTNTDVQMRQQCEEIKRAGERAASLTRQLLAFSRQQVLEPRILNLNTFCRRNRKNASPPDRRRYRASHFSALGAGFGESRSGADRTDHHESCRERP